MSFYQKSFSKILTSSSSSGSRDSTDSTGIETSGRDEEFYEEIEAPKFVDFNSPDHFRPNDRYWFCERAGCNQKHEEEMDSEAIYKKFVLRVMAARSPNVRYRKLLDRNASRSPVKCPLSAPPKSSRPRISRMALISSFSGKMSDDKKRVVRPLLKSGSTTPVMKARPVAAKYLTTPRNKKCVPNENSFRSIQNPKPSNVDMPKNRIVSKALVFHSLEKVAKVKASADLHTPITKLCDEMSKLQVSSQRNRILGYSSKSSKNLNGSALRRPLSSQKVHTEPKEQTSCSKRVAKSASSNCAINRKLTKKDESEKQKANICSVTDEGGEHIKQELLTKDARLQESRQEDDIETSGKCSNVERSDNSTSEVTKAVEDAIATSGKCSDVEQSDSSTSELTKAEESNSAEMERKAFEFIDSDHNKENASASDGNRMQDVTSEKQNGKKIFGMHGKGGQVKKIVQAPDKPVMKFKKPKPTTLKPFRLRTDERGILKEASLEKRAKKLAPKSKPANLSMPGQKLQKKQINDEQKGERTSKATAAYKPEGQKSSLHLQLKQMNTSLGSDSSKNLEKRRKIRSPLRTVSTKKPTISFLVPGQKLDVIPEASPEVRKEKVQKPVESVVPPINAAATRSSSRARQPVTVPVEPNFHSTHTPRSCTKKLKRMMIIS